MNHWIWLIAFPLALGLPAVANANDGVAATVNGAPISSRNLEDATEQLMPRGLFHGTLSEERREEFREKALEALITMELQYQDAVARGMKPDRKKVKEQMRQVREAFQSSREYRMWLDQMRLDEDQLKQRIEKKVLVASAVAAIAEAPSRLSDEAVREHYDRNRDAFVEPETVRMRIISAKDAHTAGDALVALKTGEDFGAVASRMSADNYRSRGGDLGYVQRGRLYPRLEEAAFAMKPGETSGVIDTEGEWFVIKVEDRKPSRIIPFEEVRDKLKQELEQKRKAELLEQWVSGLRAKATIVVMSAEGSEQSRQ